MLYAPGKQKHVVSKSSPECLLLLVVLEELHPTNWWLILAHSPPCPVSMCLPCSLLHCYPFQDVPSSLAMSSSATGIYFFMVVSMLSLDP